MSFKREFVHSRAVDTCGFRKNPARARSKRKPNLPAKVRASLRAAVAAPATPKSKITTQFDSWATKITLVRGIYDLNQVLSFRKKKQLKLISNSSPSLSISYASPISLRHKSALCWHIRPLFLPFLPHEPCMGLALTNLSHVPPFLDATI